MRPLLTLAFILGWLCSLSGQDSILTFQVNKAASLVSAGQTVKIGDDTVQKVFQVVDQMPQYPGGDEAMMKFVRSHIAYPDSAVNNDIQGRVVVKFIVEEDGSISNIGIAKSVEASLDAEAIRVVKLFPLFKPGKQLGKTVRVQFVLPVLFTLPSTSGKSKNPKPRTYHDLYPPQ
jgi:TonB family protein